MLLNNSLEVVVSVEKIEERELVRLDVDELLLVDVELELMVPIEVAEVVELLDDDSEKLEVDLKDEDEVNDKMLVVTAVVRESVVLEVVEPLVLDGTVTETEAVEV